jgi:oxidase EvaA
VHDTVELRLPDPLLAKRIAESTQTRDSAVLPTARIGEWLDGRRRVQTQRVTRMPLTALRGWSFRDDTGDLVHASGKFFAVEGLAVSTDQGPVGHWTQPIVNQAEIGVLGIAVKEIDGVLHCLMQAKVEPGNINGVQLSPTVQATKSNYTRVHGGAEVPYLEHFRDPQPGSVIADVLQSEQGAWFYRKRNRNMVVEVGPDVEAADGFCWLTLGQVLDLLAVDNLVSMDARTVLSCVPFGTAGPRSAADGFAGALALSCDPASGSLHTTTDVRSWMTGVLSSVEVSARRVPLNTVTGWSRTDWEIRHDRGLHFSVIGVDVEARGREVAAWQQPLVRPHGIGIAALLVRRFSGVLHALVNARIEPGYLNAVELAPTVQCTPSNYAELPPGSLPPFLEVVRGRPDGAVRFEAELSEEGGRFHHARTRYSVIEVGRGVADTEPPGYRWLAPHQLAELLAHSHYVNVQARTLVACLVGLR